MVKLATCFSGIGAIEHALNRMGIDSKIVFACDNGEVDILSKKVKLDIQEIEEEFDNLESVIESINDGDYKKGLEHALLRNERLFKQVKQELELINLSIVEVIISVLIDILKMPSVKKIRHKEYTGFLNTLKKYEDDDLNKKLYTLSIAIEIANDFHKDNHWDSLKEEVIYESKDNIDWNPVKKELILICGFIDITKGRNELKKVRDISERLSMLHERIYNFGILKELEKVDSYNEKKEYIDNLYKGKERQNKVKQSYLANYELDERHYHWNVSFLDGNEYANQVDLFVGGSPCQSFSLVGKQRGLEDTRGTLFYDYARLIKEIKPKVFIYENVKSLLSNDGGRTWETMCQVFTDLDYKWEYKTLNARDFGIPQNRERIFVVGFRKDLILTKAFEFPKPIELKATMKDFLLDNVSDKYYLPEKGVNFAMSDKNLTKKYTQIDGKIALCQKKNQQFNWHGDFIFEEENIDKEKTMQDLEKYFLSDKVKKYVLASGTKNFYSKPKVDLDIARPLLTTMHKMHRAGVDNYVTTFGRLRKLTPRECLRLMGFSDSYKIAVSDTAMYQQSGNSIVVNVLMNIINKIIESYPGIAKEEIDEVQY